MTIPDTFQLSKRCPPIQELEWLAKWCIKNKKPNLKVLEFGCGITSWILCETLSPKIQVAVEQYPECIMQVKKHCPDIEIVSTWDLIPKNNYDWLLIDSSTGWPEGIKPMTAKRPFRDDAVKYALPLCKKNVTVILHDYDHRKAGWRVARVWLENNGFECIDKYRYRFGFGIMRRNTNASTPV